MAERIIVAIDGGPAGDAALDWIVERSRTRALDVRLTTVVEPGRAGGFEEQAIAAATARLHAEAPAVQTTEFVRRGHAADTLVTDSSHADLLVVGAHPVSALTSLLGRTLAQNIAGHTRCTLIVVPEGWQSRGSGITVAWDADGSSDRAVAFAAAEASHTERELSILHAWTPLPMLAFDAIGASGVIDDELAAQELMLHEVAQHVRAAHPLLRVVESFEPGPAPRAVGRAATGAAMLVVGLHARSRVGSVLFGSLSRDLLAAPPTVIAVVPTDPSPVHVLPEILEEELR